MANIVLCDRCGSIATDRVAGGIDFSMRPDRETEFFGLCPGCVEELARWLKEFTDTNRPMIAYKQPFDPESIEARVVDPKETTEDAILNGD